MHAERYLRSILRKYAMKAGGVSRAAKARRALFPFLRNWGGKYLRRVKLSGSYAKGTNVLGGTDVDLLVCLRSDTPRTLHEIYESLFEFLRGQGFAPRRQNVSIGVAYEALRIDLVPAKKQPGLTTDHSLYVRRTDSWTKTNVGKHIRFVRASARTREIKLTKVWRQLHELDFPSFYLELAAIRALKWKQRVRLADNFSQVLVYLARDFSSAYIVDPANSNNIISEQLTQDEKAAIASEAASSVREADWADVVW